MNKEEVIGAIHGFRKEFQAEFPGEDSTQHITRFCGDRLRERMEEMLKRWFGDRPGIELIEILRYVSEEESKKAADKGRRGKLTIDRAPKV